MNKKWKQNKVFDNSWGRFIETFDVNKAYKVGKPVKSNNQWMWQKLKIYLFLLKTVYIWKYGKQIKTHL